MHIGFLSEGMDLLTGVLGAGSSGGSGSFGGSAGMPGSTASVSANISPVISPQQSPVQSPIINSPNSYVNANPSQVMPVSQQFKGGAPSGYSNPFAAPNSALPGLDTNGFFESFDVNRFVPAGANTPADDVFRAQRGIPWNSIVLGVGILAAAFIAFKYINKKSGKK